MAVHFRWQHGSQTLLLPIVILTSIIERYYVTYEEEGAAVAVGRLAGTVLVGLFCFWTLKWEFAGQCLLAYPELHLVTIGVLILLGRYRGYRLAELWRFRDLVPHVPS